MTRASQRSDDGYILVAVLGVMLVLTCFMAASSVLVRSALDSAKVGDSTVAMDGLTRGGLELAAYQLFVIKLPPETVSGRRVKFAGGMIAPRVVDEGGKIDLNAADPKLLVSLLTSTGMGSSDVNDLVARIVAMRGGAKSKTANSQSAADKALRRGFQSVDQLAEFPELMRGDLQKLAPQLTVFNPDGKVNILTASRAVLSAIPDLSRVRVEEILQRRDGATKDVIDGFQSSLGEAGAYTKVVAGPAYTVRIDATAASGRKKTINAVIAVSKSPNDPYYVLETWD